MGINYKHQHPGDELRGCVNDVLHVKEYLVQAQGFEEQHILVLVDDDCCHNADDSQQQQQPKPPVRHPAAVQPTRRTIIDALRQLVAHSQPGDCAYFHYSGHGGLLEPTGNVWKQQQQQQQNKPYYYYDETLLPLDHRVAGQIRDFSLFQHFVQPLRAGVTATCVLDCCHSGSVLNLPYSYRPTPASAGGRSMIQAQYHAEALHNLAFLYLLGGGNLGALGGVFDGVVAHIEDTVGGSVDDYRGIGMEDAVAQDGGYSNYYNDDAASSQQQQQQPEQQQDDGLENNGDDNNDGDNYNDYGDADRDTGQLEDGDGVQQDYYDTGDSGGGGWDTQAAAPQDYYRGDFGEGWDTGDSAAGGCDNLGDGGDVDVDCGCFADVLGALLDGN